MPKPPLCTGVVAPGGSTLSSPPDADDLGAPHLPSLLHEAPQVVCTEEQENGLPAPQIGGGKVGYPPPRLHRLGHAQPLGWGGGHAAGSACPHLASLFNIAPGPRRRHCSPSLGGVGAWGGWGHRNKNLGCSRRKRGVVSACATALPAPAPLPQDWVVSSLKGRSPSPPSHGGRVTAPPLQQHWQQGSGTQMALLGRDVALPPVGALLLAEAPCSPPRPAPHQRRAPRHLPTPVPSSPFPAVGHSSPPRPQASLGPTPAAVPALSPAGPALSVRRAAAGPGCLQWVPPGQAGAQWQFWHRGWHLCPLTLHRHPPLVSPGPWVGGERVEVRVRVGAHRGAPGPTGSPGPLPTCGECWEGVGPSCPPGLLTPGPQRGPLVTQQISVWQTVQRIQSQPSFFWTMMRQVGQCMASPICTRVWWWGRWP